MLTFDNINYTIIKIICLCNKIQRTNSKVLQKGMDLIMNISEKPFHLFDTYSISKERSIFTFDQHRVPGVRALARHLISNALPITRAHYHENAFEFSMTSRGCITFSVEDTPYRFSGGDVFISFPNEIHGSASLPVALGEIFWFQLDISDPSNFLFLQEETAVEIIKQLQNIPSHIVQTNADETLPLLKKAFQLTQEGQSPQFIAAHLYLFLHMLITSSNRIEFRLTPDIGKTLNYILDHITEDLALEDLAKLANLSLSQYKQKFKKQLGVSPRHFVNVQKIEHSKTLLLEGMSVTDIANHLSFGSCSYFSYVFKKYTRQSPRDYLKTHTSAHLPASHMSEKKSIAHN